MYIMQHNAVTHEISIAEIDSVVFQTPAPIPATGVTLNKESLSLIVGSSETLTAVVSPLNVINSTVTWSSSNPAAASVNAGGVVTALSVGTAVITASTQGGAHTAGASVTVLPVSVQSITLNKNLLELNIGASETLAASVLPSNATNQAVTWTSSNNAVAAVNSGGVVTAVSTGTAVITAETADGGLSATCAVIVSSITVSATGVTLNRNTLELFVNEAETLTASVQPSNASNQNVTWASNNPAVATVDADGRVTAMSAGTAVITAATVDGGHTASCIVTVPISVTGVTLNRNTLALVTGRSETLTASVLPANAANQAVTWTSSNTAAAVVDADGVVTAVSAGTAIITATTADGGHTASAAVEVEGVLIAGTIWATRNVGMPGTFVENIEDVGMFYQWNRRVGWSSTNPLVNSDGDTSWNSTNPTPSVSFWAPPNNPCPPGWRVPTREEFESLRNAGVEWRLHNGIDGRFFGTAPNQIFLPVTGWRTSTNGGLTVGTQGRYWSATATPGVGNTATRLWFTNTSLHIYLGSGARADGNAIRCVVE